MKTKLINKEDFNLLTKNEKIVAICKDVLARMEAKLIIAHCGLIFCRVDTHDDPKTFLNKNPCEVCAKGGILSSWVANFNNYSWEQIYELDDNHGERRLFAQKIPKELSEIFGSVLLDQIEVAFEGDYYRWNCEESDGFDSMFEPFISMDDYGNDEEYEEYIQSETNNRLKSIMENIIRNNGELVLEK